MPDKNERKEKYLLQYGSLPVMMGFGRVWVSGWSII